MASKAATLTTIGTALLSTAAAGALVYYLYSKSCQRAVTDYTVNDIMSLFEHNDCHLKDPAMLRSKIRKLVEGGADKLQIVTDFDRTLTKAFVDGRDGHQSYGVVEDSPYIGEAANRTLKDLRERYLPIEMSLTIPEAEKIPHMIEWWSSAMNTAATVGLQRRLIPTMVTEGRAVLRDGSNQFFYLTNEKQVPILILSAGIGDVIHEVMRQQIDLTVQGVKVVANFYSYDENGLVNGMKGELIHTFNKNEVSERAEDYFRSIHKRNNVILMGDTLGDPGMADGIKNVNAIIKIGYLNKNVEESLSSYLGAYDIVLTNDATMDIVNLMLQRILL